MPNSRMAPDQLFVRLGPIHEEVGAGEVECVLAGLRRVPLHAVLGRHLAEIGLDDGGILGPGSEGGLVCGGAEVLLSLGFESSVDGGGGRAAVQGDVNRAGNGESREGQESDSGTHFVD